MVLQLKKVSGPCTQPGDQVYLDAVDIKTTCPSPKLSHCRLGPFKIECQVGLLAYYFKLPHRMRQLHPVFNMVKLSATLEDLIPGRKPQALLPPIVVDREADVRGPLGPVPTLLLVRRSLRDGMSEQPRSSNQCQGKVFYCTPLATYTRLVWSVCQSLREH